MKPTIDGFWNHDDDYRFSDGLTEDKATHQRKTDSEAEPASQIDIRRAPGYSQWRKDLSRLKPLEKELALLPVGWGKKHKGPMLRGWVKHEGFTVSQLKDHQGMRAVGARTGLFTGPLLCFDFDGRTAFGLGLTPQSVGSWQVHRTTDPWHPKVLFRPTPEQLRQLPAGAEFFGKTITALSSETNKAEALEVFFYGARQVVVLGEHPSSQGYYFWPKNMGPENLAPPPEDWWAYAIRIAEQSHHKKTKRHPTSSKPQGTHRLNPCPICGRHDGPGGSSLWCEQTRQGLILCMPGATFNAECRHGRLRIGQVVEGWALVKRTAINEGDVLVFKSHNPTALAEIRASLKSEAEAEQ